MLEADRGDFELFLLALLRLLLEDLLPLDFLLEEVGLFLDLGVDIFNGATVSSYGIVRELLSYSGLNSYCSSISPPNLSLFKF